MYFKSKLNLWGALGTFVTLAIIFHTLNLNRLQTNHRSYLEASELTNYTLLESLVTGRKNTSNSPEMNNNRYTPPYENRINFNLHSLTDLASSISLNQSYTIITQYHDEASLKRQLDSILRQTYKPSVIYVIGLDKEKSIIETVIQHDSNTILYSPATWFGDLKDTIDTDFVAVLNTHQVQLGTDYMEFILSLLDTPHFRNTFMSTEGCSSTLNQAHYVNKIEDIWVFRNEWYSALSKQQHPSQTLYQSLQIPSVLIPTLENYPQLKGNTQQQQETICTPTEHVVLFYIQNATSTAFQQLICQFNKRHGVIHVASATSIQSNLCPPNDHVILHHTITSVKNEFNHLVNVLSPHVVIYEAQDSFMTDMSISSTKQIHETTFIGLPKLEDVTTFLWIADLPITSLQQWNTPKVKLVVTTSGNKKLNNVKRIIQSLQNADYLNDQVDLYLLMDEKSDDSTKTYMDHVPWHVGKKHIRHRIANVHPMQHFVESWYPSDDHEYAVMLDDRVEASPLFYVWLKQTLLKYRYSTTQNKQLFGISLYSPRIIDTDPSGRQLLERHDDSSYLMQVPSGFGALYFPEYWREFHDYITARLTDRAIVKKKAERHLFQDDLLTESRTNSWIHSWRKYFDEVVYMRGYVMLYPSYDKSYSTVYIKVYENVDKLFHVSLSSTVSPQLPEMDSLPVLDYYGKPAQQHELVSRGHEIQRTFSACEPVIDHHNDPSDMLCPFSQLIQIPIDQKDVPVLTVNLSA